MITIAVVGPQDLVALTIGVLREMGRIDAVAVPYQHESETPAILRKLDVDVDALLFTGVVPYTIASSHDLLGSVAGYVEYGGSVLLSSLIGIQRDGRDIQSLSIDTLNADEVSGTLAEAGISLERVRVLPYSAATDASSFVDFHRRAHEEDPDAIALTCLGSVYDQLKDVQPTVRLAPAKSAIRLAVNRLQLLRDSRHNGDAQLVLGIVEIEQAAEPLLTAELAPLGASLVQTGPREFLVVATRGPLEDATGGLAGLPMLNRLKMQHSTVRIGFGLGGSGAEAHQLARRALGRARAVGRSAAVISLRNDIDIPLSEARAPRGTQRSNLPRLANRAGLSVATLQRLQELVRQLDKTELTTRDLASHLEMQPRTARRILNRLERAGLARDVGSQSLEGSGRPLVVYRIML